MHYPNNIKKKKNTYVDYGNRGMDLEHLINDSNQYYLENDIALIFKKATPIGIAKVKYNVLGKEIEKAYFKEKSTLDYNGLYKGKYIEFDAKETMNKTSFPIANVHEHQIEHIRSVLKHKGICFLIIKMNGLFYLLFGSDFIQFIDNNNRKSIPYSFLEEHAHLIKESYYPSLDYLKVIDEYVIKEN